MLICLVSRDKHTLHFHISHPILMSGRMSLPLNQIHSLGFRKTSSNSASFVPFVGSCMYSHLKLNVYVSEFIISNNRKNSRHINWDTKERSATFKHYFEFLKGSYHKEYKLNLWFEVIIWAHFTAKGAFLEGTAAKSKRVSG